MGEGKGAVGDFCEGEGGRRDEEYFELRAGVNLGREGWRKGVGLRAGSFSLAVMAPTCCTKLRHVSRATKGFDSIPENNAHPQ